MESLLKEIKLITLQAWGDLDMQAYGANRKPHYPNPYMFTKVIENPIISIEKSLPKDTL